MKRASSPALAFLLAGGCVFYVQSSRMVGQVDQAVGKINESRAKVKEDLSLKTKVFAELAARTKTPEAPPYPRAARLLKSMAGASRDVDTEVAEFKRLRDATAALAKRKDRITSKDPEYAEAKRIRGELKASLGRLESKFQAYSAVSKELEALISAHSIARMDMSGFKPKVGQALKDFDEKTDKASAGIRKARRRIKRLKPEDRQKARDGLARLDGILSEMREERKRFELKAVRFRREVKTRSTLWVGPGMASVSIYSDLKASADKIKSLADEFTAVAESLGAKR